MAFFLQGGQIQSENPICSLWTQACGFVRKHYPEKFHCIEGWRGRCCSLDRLSSDAKGRRKVVVRSIYSDDEKRLRSIAKLLHYAFFDRYHISRLTEIRPEMVKDFLNDYGLCRLPDDNETVTRGKETVATCIAHVIDFLDSVSRTVLLPDYVRRKPAMYEDRILPLGLECDSKCAMDRSSMSLLIFARRQIAGIRTHLYLKQLGKCIHGQTLFSWKICAASHRSITDASWEVFKAVIRVDGKSWFIQIFWYVWYLTQWQRRWMKAEVEIQDGFRK